MKSIKQIVFGVLVVSCCFSISTQARQKQGGSCFEDVVFSPSFIALETTFESDLQQWYKDVFQLETVKEFTFPDGKTKGSLMKRGDFIVEVFNKSSLDMEKRKKTPGVMKFGFFTNANLEKLQECLVNQDIKAKRIFKDKNLNASLLLIEDPEGNHFEVIAKDR